MEEKGPLNKQTMLQGALTLTLAWLILRILGALYRIPLGRMLGGEGLGIFAVPNQFYQLFFTLCSAGIPVAVAGVVSEKMALGQYRDAVRAFKITRIVMLLLGLFFSLLLFFGAGWLIKSGVIPNPDAFLGMRAVAPVIFFAAITASYRGFFQGLQDMRAVAYSQVVDQIILVIATLSFSYLLLPRGLTMAAAGANLGALPGAVAAMLMLIYVYYRQSRGVEQYVLQDVSGVREGTLSLLKRIFSTSIPVSFVSVAMSITAILDHKLIVDRLQLVGYTQDQAVAWFGRFNQMSMSFINISIALALSLGTSLVPAAAKAFAMQDLERIRKQVLQAVRLSLLLALPASAGLFLLSHHLTQLAFADASAGVPLAALSWAVIFWSVHLVTTGTLQGLNKALVPTRNLIIGILVKIAITYFLTPTWLGIRAAAFGNVTIFIISSTLNCIALARLVGVKFNIWDAVAKGVLATLVMSAGVLAVYRWAHLGLGGNSWPTLLAIVAGAVVYPVVLVFIGGIQAEDVRRLPGGRRVADFLGKIGRG